MKELLETISRKSIELEDLESQGKTVTNDWLGNTPVSENEILLAETRLNVKFPKDYREFLLITNGFMGPNDIEPSFSKLEEVNYLKKILPEINEIYQIKELDNAILIGGASEEQQFLLIPPSSDSDSWKYWKFANWIPGEEEYSDLRNYFEQVLEFLVDSNS
ncbi:SMI1/KNR4 family protein [Pedobacter sp.]|uniref:SMI1/KNR4 family protein n=1 Tax=Pedobacter sp. TaxID=1411316 RepID=UPI0031CFF112